MFSTFHHSIRRLRTSGADDRSLLVISGRQLGLEHVFIGGVVRVGEHTRLVGAGSLLLIFVQGSEHWNLLLRSRKGIHH